MKTTETIATVTTTDADNNKTVVKTITTENKTPNGSTGVIVRDEDGNILSQSTTISKEAEEKALENAVFFFVSGFGFIVRIPLNPTISVIFVQQQRRIFAVRTSRLD